MMKQTILGILLITISLVICSNVNAQVVSATDVNGDPNIFEAYLTADEQDVTIAGATVHAMVYRDDPPIPFLPAEPGIPSPQLKVKVGDLIIIHLKNNLASDSTSGKSRERKPSRCTASPASQGVSVAPDA